MPSGNKNCGFCNKEKPFHSECHDCRMFLCAPCTKIHRNISQLKGHKISELSQVMKSLESSINSTLKELNATHNNASKVRENKSREINRLKREEEDAIRILSNKEEKEIDAVKVKYKQLKAEAAHEYEKARSEISNSREIDSLIHKIEDNQNRLEDVREKKNDKNKNAFISSGTAALEQAKKDLPEIHLKVKELK